MKRERTAGLLPLLALLLLLVLPAGLLRAQGADRKSAPGAGQTGDSTVGVTLSGITEVEQLALENNLEYRSALLDLMKAEHALEPVVKLGSSSVDLAATWQNGSSDTIGEQSSGDAAGILGWQASATLPVIEQLSLGASVNQELQSTINISFSPLAHSAADEQSLLNYRQKTAAAEEAARQTADSAVESYLAWIVASRELELKRASTEVKQSLYEDEKVRYQLDQADLEDVRQALTAWSQARSAATAAETTLRSAETDLARSLNIDPAGLEIQPITEEALDAEINRLEAQLARSDLSVEGSYTLSKARSAAETLELELDNSWLFEPRLALTGALTVSPDTPDPRLSATISLGFSPDSWKGERRQELAEELEISRRQALQSRNSEELKLTQLRNSVETGRINYELAALEVEQAKELLDEASFLFDQGDYSASSLAEAQLQYRQSLVSRLSAAATLHTTLRSLLRYALD